MMKKIFKSLLILFAVCIFLIGFTPTILSTQSGQKHFFRFLSLMTRMKIEASNVNLSWFSDQELLNFHFKTATSDIYVDKIKIDSSLFYPLLHKGRFKEITLVNPEGVVKLNQEKSSFIFLPFHHLELLNGNIQLQTSEKTYKFQNISCEIDLKDQLMLKTSGNLALGLDKGSFFLSLTHANKQVEFLNVKTENFSLTWLDEILKESNHDFFITPEIGTVITGNLLFDRKNKITQADLKTPIAKALISPKSPHLVEITSQTKKGLRKLESSDLVIDYDSLINTEGKFQLIAEFLELDDLLLKKLTAVIDLGGKKGFNFDGNALFSDPNLTADMRFQGHMVDLFKELNLSLQIPKIYFKTPFFTKTQAIDTLEANFKFKDYKWQAFISAKNILDLQLSIPLMVNIQSEPVEKIYELPKTIAVNIASSVLNTSTQLNLKETISFQETTFFSLEIPKELVSRFAPEVLSNQPLIAQGVIEKNSSVKKLNGYLGLKPIAFKADDQNHELKIDTIEFSIEPKAFLGSMEINGSLDGKALTIDLQKEVAMENFEFKTTLLPTKPLIAIFPDIKPLEPLLNPTLSGFINLNRKKGKTFLETHLSSGDFLLKFNGALDSDKVYLTKPANLNFRYHLKNDNQLFEETDFYLVSSPLVQMEINEFSFPIDQNFNEIFTQGKIAIDDLKLFSDRKITKIDRIEGNFRKKITQPLIADFATFSSKGKFQSQLRIDNLDLRKKTDLLSSFKGLVKVDALDVPNSFFRLLLAPLQIGKYAQIFGEKINGKLLYSTDEIEPVFSLTMDSENFRFRTKGKVENSLLTLSEPIELELIPNDALKELIFDKSQVHIMETVNPITFNIPTKGFLFSLKEKEPSAFKIPYFALDFGKVNVKNDGNMEMLSQFFRRPFSSTTRLWFAPIEGSYRSGIMQIGRTEILISPNIQVAIWGKLDFNKQKVDMVLGLTASSLQNTLGITNLPQNFVLTVPIRGTFDKIQIDKGQALTKIATLIASGQKFSGQLGNVLDFMNQMMNDQGAIPKPKRPFPWEKKVSYQEVPLKKDFQIKFKGHTGIDDLASYSLSIDPLFSIIQNQIDTLLEKKEVIEDEEIK